jgi:hypothetical protein
MARAGTVVVLPVTLHTQGSEGSKDNSELDDTRHLREELPSVRKGVRAREVTGGRGNMTTLVDVPRQAQEDTADAMRDLADEPGGLLHHAGRKTATS